jgi:plastocyanin
MTTQAAKPSRKKLWIIVAAAVVVVVVVVGVFAVLMNQSVSPPAAPSGPNVVIWSGNFCNNAGNCGFVAGVHNVTVGTTVTWTNRGGMMHTVTICDANHSASQCPALDATGLDSFDSQVAGGDMFSHTFTVAGTYYYYCRPHPWMQGEIIVH